MVRRLLVLLYLLCGVLILAFILNCGVRVDIWRVALRLVLHYEVSHKPFLVWAFVAFDFEFSADFVKLKVSIS